MNLKIKIDWNDSIAFMGMLNESVNTYRAYAISSSLSTEIAYPIFVCETLRNLHDRLATIVNNGQNKGCYKYKLTLTTSEIYCIVKAEIPVNNIEYLAMVKQEIFEKCCVELQNQQMIYYSQIDKQTHHSKLLGK